MLFILSGDKHVNNYYYLPLQFYLDTRLGNSVLYTWVKCKDNLYIKHFFPIK